jgi:circadian clock protein KaiC
MRPACAATILSTMYSPRPRCLRSRVPPGAATDQQRLHDYLYALVQHFAVSTITSILTFETFAGAVTAHGVDNAMSYLSDNVMLLTVGGEERTRRSIRILKTRGSGHDLRIRDVAITGAGLEIVE